MVQGLVANLGVVAVSHNSPRASKMTIWRVGIIAAVPLSNSLWTSALRQIAFARLRRIL